MRAEWLRSVDDLRRRDWDALTNDTDLFRCCDWLELTASSDPEMEAAPEYLMVLGDDLQPMAGSPVYVQAATSMPDPFVRVDVVQRRLLTGAGRDWAADLMPGMVLGGWALFDCRVLLGGGPASRAALTMALDEIEGHAHRSGVASMTFMYVDGGNTALREELSSRGFVSAAAPSRLVMNIGWDDFGGYLSSLARKRRYSVRAEERLLEESGVRFELGELTAADVPTFARLAYAVGSKYEPELTVPEIERWLATLQRSGFPAMILRATLAGSLCAFLILIEWRGVLYPQHFGIDYELKRKLPVYFALVYYEPIRYAIRRGLRRIEYSIGSEHVKRSRGCESQPQWTYVRASDPDVHASLAQCFERGAGQELRT